ncbi:MAG: electron transfer flavoprotein subunit alpha/FixB family protein, partial [Bacteroidota bacterium]
MSVLVFVDNQAGKATKASLEAVSYAKSVADQTGGSVTAVTFGNVEGDAGVGAYGASKILVASGITAQDSKQLAGAMAQAVEQEGASVIVLSHDHTGKHIGPRLSVKLQAGMV